MRCLYSVLLPIALLLGGCSTTRVVDSDVQAFATLPAIVTPATYRFERRPSQQAQPVTQAQLESLAQQALARVGLQRDDDHARFSIQVDSRVQRISSPIWVDPWYGPWGGGGWHGRYAAPWGSAAWWGPASFREPDTFVREVELVIRDLSTQQIAFESRARHESLRPGDDQTLAAMLDSALNGFPQPPQGMRRLRVEIPPASTAVPTAPPAPAG